jgi:protein gp37
VAGGESQTDCRPMDPDWARVLLARCWGRTDMGRPWALPFHMKQLGGHPNPRKKLHELPPDLQVRDYPTTAAKGGR